MSVLGLDFEYEICVRALRRAVSEIEEIGRGRRMREDGVLGLEGWMSCVVSLTSRFRVGRNTD